MTLSDGLNGGESIVRELFDALSDARNAIQTLDEDVFGLVLDQHTGMPSYPVRDELLSKIDRALFARHVIEGMATTLRQVAHVLQLAGYEDAAEAALAAAAEGGDVQQAPGEAPQSGDAKAAQRPKDVQ